MSTYSNRLQPALQNLLQRVVQFFHQRSSCTMKHTLADVHRITLNVSCTTISGRTTKHILPHHWLYEWFSQFHSCGTYSVLSRSHSVVYLVNAKCQLTQITSLHIFFIQQYIYIYSNQSKSVLVKMTDCNDIIPHYKSRSSVLNSLQYNLYTKLSWEARLYARRIKNLMQKENISTTASCTQLAQKKDK